MKVNKSVFFLRLPSFLPSYCPAVTSTPRTAYSTYTKRNHCQSNIRWHV